MKLQRSFSFSTAGVRLVEVGFIGAAAAFGDEEELVFVAPVVSASRSIWAGRLVAVFFSLNISSGAIWE